jgi:hypothetical protein
MISQKVKEAQVQVRLRKIKAHWIKAIDSFQLSIKKAWATQELLKDLNWVKLHQALQVVLVEVALKDSLIHKVNKLKTPHHKSQHIQKILEGAQAKMPATSTKTKKE